MGAGTIIASAIVIVLLIVTGYVLIGGTLSTAQIVMAAQRAAADQESHRIHTRIEIFSAVTDNASARTVVVVNNTGSETVGDFDHMELFLLQDGTPYMYENQSGPYNWTYTISPDEIHPGLLDPDEAATITVPYEAAKGNATWVKVITANGLSDSRYTTFI